MKPLYIFDLDGTIALIDHRRPILDNKDNPHRWDEFYKACVNDVPNKPVIDTMQRLNTTSDVWIWSGRSSIVNLETMDWLEENTRFNRFELYGMLRMRDDGDYTPDDQLKIKWLNQLTDYNRGRLVAIFDDRKKVVDAWRKNGVTCFQVADGDF